ncbi:MAG: lipoate--protein ligase, partial [Oscillibacter sp.]
MNEQVTYLETLSQSPTYNLAFEEFVLQNRREGDYLLLWQNDNTIVIGQNQNAEAEINRAFVEEHGIHVVRRTTGGGAVYHDLGNLNYSFITDAGDAERMTMERFTRPIVEALRGLGIEAEASGRNDILAEGRKVSGTAQRLVKGRIL